MSNKMDVEKVKDKLENDDLSDHKRRVLEIMLEERELLDALASNGPEDGDE